MRIVFRAIILLFLSASLCAPIVAQTVAENDSSATVAKEEKSLPLITSRTMAFSTTEGSWMSLDLSPDGETIVFEILGDLYTVPISGGNATRITSGQGYDMQPRYSPDGEKIVFISDRNGSENIWTANADGSEPEARTSGEKQNFMSPEWTPDGTAVVAVKGSHLWMYHQDGGSGLQITGTGDSNSGGPSAFIGPAFGPDDRYIWVNIRGNVGGGFSLTSAVTDGDLPEEHKLDAVHGLQSSTRRVGPYQIARYDRDTGDLRVITHEHEGAFRPVPSPDGKWLVYATRHDTREALKLLNLVTGEEHWLLMDVQRDDSQGGGSRDRDVYPGSAFTPDSGSLITSFNGKIMSVDIPSGASEEISFSAQVDQEIGPLVKFDYPIDDNELIISQIRGARPSPDGSRIAFTALDYLHIGDLPESEDIEITDSTVFSVNNIVRLTESTNVEHAPVFSPDGKWLAYVTWNDVEGGHVYRIKTDGSSPPEQLTPMGAFFDKVAFSKDGKRIFAIMGSKMHRMRTLEDFGRHSGTAEMKYVWIPFEGGAPVEILWTGSAATQQGYNAPHPGPDPDRVYIWTGSDGLLSVRYDGSDPRIILNVSGPSNGSSSGGNSTPNQVILSPDGKRAIVQASRNAYMITVPPLTGIAPTVSVSGSSLPGRKLSDIGGDFVGWNSDGSAAHYSIGRSFFAYDPEAADAVDAANKLMDEERESQSDDGVDKSAEIVDKETTDEDNDDRPTYVPHRYDVNIAIKKDKPEGTVLLRGARLLTMRGKEIIESGDILVRDNRITSIGASGTLTVPLGTDVLEMQGKTIMPGLVDIHAHTWVAWGVHRKQVSQFLAQLAYGVTTQRDPQTSSEDVLTYGDLMDAGELIGPRIYSTGPGVFSNDNIKSLDDARKVLRRYSDHFNTKTIKQYLAGDRKVRQWVIMAARELGLTPTTEGGSNFTMNMTLMQDGYAGLEHSLPISPFYFDVVNLTAFSGITYTPTLIVSYGGPSGLNYYLTHSDLDGDVRLKRFTPHDELDKWKTTTFYRDDQYVFPLHAKQLTKVVEAGGRVGLGSHGEVQGLGTHWELWMMAAGQMKPHDALLAATIHGADAIGFDQDLGSLEAGKLADLIVLDQNPLDDIQNTTSIRYVMKNGRLYESLTLDEIWPRKRTLPEQWWWRVEPSNVPSATSQDNSSESTPCTMPWYKWVEKQIGTGDGQGHGPDPGSNEWKSVVLFRLGLRGVDGVPDIASPAWCGYVDDAISNRN